MHASVRRLLAGAIDYAGLFPPAALDLSAAVSRYGRDRRGPHAWLLGRFVVPAARLDELEAAVAAEERGGPAGDPWPVSALIGEDPTRDAPRATAVRACVRVDAIEVRAASLDDIRTLSATFAAVPERWLEVAPGLQLEPCLEAIREAGAGAKLRTGGVQAGQFPTPEAVGAFIVGCLRAGVPFKATAGLHHAWRGTYRLTYAEDSPTARMFGFLNLLLAAAIGRSLLQAGAPATDVVATLIEVLDAGGAAQVVWEPTAITWLGHRVDLDGLAAARRMLRGFGSCSFDEPVAELRELGLL